MTTFSSRFYIMPLHADAVESRMRQAVKYCYMRCVQKRKPWAELISGTIYKLELAAGLTARGRGGLACSWVLAAGLSSRSWSAGPRARYSSMADAEGEDEETLEICKVTCVRSAKFSPWYPDVKLVDGIEYVKLSPWDRDLCRFATGSFLRLRRKGEKPKHTLRVRFFPETKALRSQACNRALQEFLWRAADEAGAARPEKIRPAREEDEYIVKRSIVLSMPDVGGHGPLPIRFLWGVKSDLYMELSVANLNYIKVAIKESPPIVKDITKANNNRRPVGRPRKRRQLDPEQGDGAAADPPSDEEARHSEASEVHGFMPAFQCVHVNLV